MFSLAFLELELLKSDCLPACVILKLTGLINGLTFFKKIRFNNFNTSDVKSNYKLKSLNIDFEFWKCRFFCLGAQMKLLV